MESSQVGEKANLPFKEVMYDGYVKLINITDYINASKEFNWWIYPDMAIYDFTR